MESEGTRTKRQEDERQLTVLTFAGLPVYGVTGLALHAFFNPGEALIGVFDDPTVTVAVLVVGGSYVVWELVRSLILAHRISEARARGDDDA